MTTLLIDDLRSFRDGRTALVARTSAQGLATIEALRGQQVESIWLDHDLGELGGGRVDDVMTCVDRLCELAFNGDPVDVQTIYVHTSNPVGRDQMLQSLRRWGYNAQPAQADDHFIAWDLTRGSRVPPQPGETSLGDYECEQCDA